MRTNKTMKFTLHALNAIGMAAIFGISASALAADAVGITQLAQAPTIGERALEALGLDPVTSTLTFDLSDPVGYDVFTTPTSGFPTKGNSFLALSSGCVADALVANLDHPTGCRQDPDSLKTTDNQDLVQATLTTPIPADAACLLVDWKLFTAESIDRYLTGFSDAPLIENSYSLFQVNGDAVYAPFNQALDESGQNIRISSTGLTQQYPSNARGTSYTSATTNLITQMPVDPGQGTQTLTFSAFDIGDSDFDSTVFLNNVRFSSTPCEVPFATPAPDVPPTINVSNASVTVNEGSLAVNNGIFYDLDNDPVTISSTIGAVTQATDGSGTWSWSFRPPDGPATMVVTLTANDGRGGTTAVTFDVVVANVSPSVGAISVPTDPVQVGAAVSVSAPFSDPGLLDTHVGLWEWGDGLTGTASIGSGVASGSHAFQTPGLYTIGLSVADNNGATGSATSGQVVIFDPEAGFVTGGGWANSPPGAYSVNPALNGKVKFNFVANYQKGSVTPRGGFEFDLADTSLRFKATSLAWLALGTDRASFSGEGTISQTGRYGFQVTAVVDPSHNHDTLQMKVWDATTQQVVYQTPGPLPLAGGSINLHPK